MLLVARDDEGYNRFYKAMHGLPVGEGLEIAPNKMLGYGA